MERSKWLVVSTVILVAVSGCTGGGSSPAESPSSTTPAGFELAWSYDAGSPTSVPAVNGDIVYVSTRDGRVLALPMDCGNGGTPCAPDWTGDTRSVLVQACCRANFGGIPTQYPPPLVADGLVFVTSAKDSRTFAFDLECGADGTACAPAWTEDGVGSLEPLLASDGFLYEVNESEDWTLFAYRTACARGGSTCDPEWVAPDWWWPTVADGILYNGTAPHAYDAATGSLLWTGAGAVHAGSLCTPPLTQGQKCSIPGVSTVGEGIVVTHTMTGFTGTKPSTLHAYATGCGTDGEACAPLWTARTSDLFLSTQQLAITHGRVFVGTEIGVGSANGHVLAYETDCRTDGGLCEPSLDVLVPDGEVAVLSPTVAGDQVLFTSLEQGFVEAFAAGAGVDGSSSEPLWRTVSMAGPARPVVADGIAYVADSNGSLWAFNMSCSTSGETCQPIARYQASSGVVLPPVVANGYVFAGTEEGEVLAFVAPRAS